MPGGNTVPKWGVERRLEFIEFRLYWEGRVNRSDIVEAFDGSVPQAPKDLMLYRERAPHNAVYDKIAKRYVASETFRPCFLKPDAAHYLTQLRSVAEDILPAAASWIAHFPSYSGPPVPTRDVTKETPRTVLSAIRNNLAIEIKYQSLSRPEPRWRWIAPHAIGFDGFRWHARAFCQIDQSYKDFLLARDVDVRGFKPNDVEPGSDTDWKEEITLEIGSHSELSEPQAKVIALDYSMRGKTKIKVHRALLYDAQRRLGLDTDPNARRPEEQQIVLLNREVVDENYR